VEFDPVPRDGTFDRSAPAIHDGLVGGLGGLHAVGGIRRGRDINLA
jgi:hypothetical protein